MLVATPGYTKCSSFCDQPAGSTLRLRWPWSHSCHDNSPWPPHTHTHTLWEHRVTAMSTQPHQILVSFSSESLVTARLKKGVLCTKRDSKGCRLVHTVYVFFQASVYLLMHGLCVSLREREREIICVSACVCVCSKVHVGSVAWAALALAPLHLFLLRQRGSPIQSWACSVPLSPPSSLTCIIQILSHSS